VDLAASTDAGGRTVLTVAGEVDIHVADQLRDAGLAAATAGPGDIAVDVSRVTFIDSSGLAALVAINNALDPPGRRLALLRPSRAVRRILELTGLTAAFAVTE
jgi:anti-anti-sigma factor